MRFYCSDDTVDLEQYPYHVRDVHISDPFIPVSYTHLCSPLLNSLDEQAA